MQTKNPIPIQPSPRTWVFSTDLRARLPLVVLLWSTCWLLTGCGSGKRSYQQFIQGQDPAIPSHPAIQAPIVNWHDLTEQSSDETFEQFFIDHKAEAIWYRLIGYFYQTEDLIDVSIIDTDSVLNGLLSPYTPKVQAELKVAMIAYIKHRNQETTFRDFLFDQELGEIWESLDQARGQATLDLSRQLQSCATSLKIEVLEGIVRFILNHCPKLIRLSLSSNGLQALPDNFGDLKNLQILNLNDNQLKALPETFGNLINLNELDLSCNELDVLPDTFINLKNLEELNLSNNQLTQFPACLLNLKQLQKLYLNHNRLKALPETFGNLTNLNNLGLMYNQLQVLPDTFGGFKKLKTLMLGFNRLTKLPDNFGNLTQLEILILACNQLTTLPLSFQNLTNLSAFIVLNNPLLDPNTDLNGTYFLLTNDNMQYNPLSPNVYQQAKINKGTCDLVINRDICQVTLPICPKYIQCGQSCSAILLIQQLGALTLPHPVPLYLSSWREIVEQRYSRANVFLINETIKPETRQ